MNNKIAPNTELSELNITTDDIDKAQIRRAEIMLKYADGQNYNKDRIEGEVKIHMQQSAMSMFQAGKRLILLREHEDHGDFLNCLERIGMKQRTAYNIINAAETFIDENGGLKLQSIASLPITKIFDLVRLDEEDIDELTENGEIEGLTIKEAQEMTTRELRKRIRELNAKNRELEEQAEQQTRINEEILQDKNKKIDELDSKLRTVTDNSRWDEKAEDYLLRLQRLTPRFSQVIGEFCELVSEIEKMNVKDFEQSQLILIEQAKFSMGMMLEDLGKLDDQLNYTYPEGNPAYHLLNDLKVISARKSGEAKEVEYAD